MNDENRLMAIETKSAYQEKTLNELSDVVFEQQKQIDSLTLTIEKLKQKVSELAEIIPGNPPANEKPPHY